MLKTVSAEERAETYRKQNPREIKPFTREAARKMQPGKTQLGMHDCKD
jgi:hypothetical protein